MLGWLDHWAHRHAEELIEEAQRRHLARVLRAARRDGRRPTRELARRMVDLARGTFASEGTVEQPGCEECFAK